MSIEILFELTEQSQKKVFRMQIARKLVFNKLDRLFKYLHPFVFEKDVKSLEYVLKVIKIICNCAD